MDKIKRTITLAERIAKVKKKESELTLLKLEIADKQKQLSSKKREIEEMNRQIDKLRLSIGEISVSDHAVVRYLERVLGIDIEDLKKQILPEYTKSLIKSVGGSGEFMIEKAILVVQDNKIVTVKPKK